MDGPKSKGQDMNRGNQPSRETAICVCVANRGALLVVVIIKTKTHGAPSQEGRPQGTYLHVQHGGGAPPHDEQDGNLGNLGRQVCQTCFK